MGRGPAKIAPANQASPSNSNKSWSTEEKLQLFISIVKAFQSPIPWDKVNLPNGRTVKAAVCMVDKVKKNVGIETPKTKTPKGSTQKPKESGGETTPTQKRKRATPKIKEEIDQGGDMVIKKEAIEADDETDLEELIFNQPKSKKMKKMKSGDDEDNNEIDLDHKEEKSEA